MIEKKCKYCNKVFEGYTKKQVNHMYKQHVLSKHPKVLRITKEYNRFLVDLEQE